MHSLENTSRKVIQQFFLNSTHWDKVIPRQDDIIIASCYKAGTTLTQQIVNLLLNGNNNADSMRAMSPWMDSGRFIPDPEEIEALPSPRFLKSHLPVDALPWHPEWKYIYLARDPRDVGLSLFNHCRLIEDELEGMGKGNSIDNGPADFLSFWDHWVETGKPRWDFWENTDSWWKARHLPNVLLIHFADLTKNKAGEAERIAGFLGCPWNPSVQDRVLDYSSLDYMKSLESVGKFGSTDKAPNKAGFIHKGTNGRWKDLLTEKQLERYQEIIAKKLEPDCIEWLVHGGQVG
jgi:aryl sulfotransferase